MTITPDLPSPSGPDAENRLEDLLTELASIYASMPVPAQGLQDLEQRFRLESRQLSEQDLEWLAAAGTLFPLSDLEDLS